jgi:hypothetical protein
VSAGCRQMGHKRLKVQLKRDKVPGQGQDRDKDSAVAAHAKAHTHPHRHQVSSRHTWPRGGEPCGGRGTGRKGVGLTVGDLRMFLT